MTRLILSIPSRSRGRHWLRDTPTQPLTTCADLVVRFRESDRISDRQTWVLFGGILAAGLATIVAPFIAAGMGCY